MQLAQPPLAQMLASLISVPVRGLHFHPASCSRTLGVGHDGTGPRAPAALMGSWLRPGLALAGEAIWRVKQQTEDLWQIPCIFHSFYFHFILKA